MELSWQRGYSISSTTTREGVSEKYILLYACTYNLLLSLSSTTTLPPEFQPNGVGTATLLTQRESRRGFSGLSLWP